MANNQTTNIKADLELRKVSIKLNNGITEGIDVDVLWRLGPYEFPVMQSLTSVMPNPAVAKTLSELVEKLNAMLYNVLLNQRKTDESQPQTADPKTTDS